MEECGPCLVFASYTLTFALQLRKKHGKTSVRVAGVWQYTYYTLPKHPHITKLHTHTHTHTITKNTHTATHYKTHRHTPTHYKTHTHTHTHTHTLQNPHIHAPKHYKTHIYTQRHTLQNNIKPPQYKLKQTQHKIYPNENSHNINKYRQWLLCFWEIVSIVY